MKKILLLSSVLFILITACGSAGASLPVTPATTPTPSPAPSSTPSPTETATSAPAKFTSTLVGVSPEFAQKLDREGINESLNDDGTIKSITVGYNPDGTAIVEKDVKIVASGINFQTDFQGNILKDTNGKPISQDIHNEGYPNGVVTGIDEQGKAVFWSEAEKAWMRPIELKTDNLESPNDYRFGKTQWLETALLNPELNKPFDQAAIDAWKASPGYSIYFEYNPATASAQVILQPRSGQSSIRWVLDADGKPVFFKTTTPDGITRESILIQLLNPADPSNPKPEETLFALATPGEWWQAPGQESPGANYRALFKNWYMAQEDFTKTLSPRIYLAESGNWFAGFSWGSFPPRPNLDSLFDQPGNDPGELPLFAYPISEADKAGFGNNDNLLLMQWNFGETESLPSEMQKILFPLSFASR